eukprot:TRINITY_DN72900_c0_g1_i1.p1 TRINITY_DN72900_c0_g1~~TRINITY_DN72900_c0_g1_i1.p1  ORF type:complete len:220 (-),score=36.12 TRINITY_DN72900_c0_g1_i1:140-799(-)
MGAVACNCVSMSLATHEHEGDFVDRAAVYINIYDLNENCQTVNHIANDIMQIGGAFHAGIEIYGCEYSYGENGVTCSDPRQHEVHLYRQSIPMGTTLKTDRQVKAFMQGVMNDRWRGEDYHLFSCNCCSFVDAACKNLTGRGLPGWVNRLARFASTTGFDPESLANVGNCVSTPRMPVSLASHSEEKSSQLQRCDSSDSETTAMGSECCSSLDEEFVTL